MVATFFVHLYLKNRIELVNLDFIIMTCHTLSDNLYLCLLTYIIFFLSDKERIGVFIYI